MSLYLSPSRSLSSPDDKLSENIWFIWSTSLGQLSPIFFWGGGWGGGGLSKIVMIIAMSSLLMIVIMIYLDDDCDAHRADTAAATLV